MVGGFDLFQRSVCVILLVCASKISAVKFSIVFLLAVIRQRLAGNLPAGDASAITETRNKQGADTRISLKAIQNGLNTFVDEGYGSHLNANGSAGRLHRLGEARGHTGSRYQFRKFSPGELAHRVMTASSAGAALNGVTQWPTPLSIFCPLHRCGGRSLHRRRESRK